MYLLRCIFGISFCFFSGTVAREAIIGGLPARNQRPSYQVSVRFHDGNHICGGGIIGDLHILTAAHCVLNRTRHLRSRHISVLAGTYYLNHTNPPAVAIRVEKVFFPSEFYPAVEFNIGDIAVLKLVDSLQLQDRTNLRKLELPRDYEPALGIGMITGFGWQVYNKPGHGGSNGHLQFTLSDVHSDSECEMNYPQGAIQSDRHLCTSDKHNTDIRDSHGVCIGDAGGPLVEYKKVVIGILSRIPSDCDERHEPAVYTRVTHYLRMILNVMGHGHDRDMISLHT